MPTRVDVTPIGATRSGVVVYDDVSNQISITQGTLTDDELQDLSSMLRGELVIHRVSADDRDGGIAEVFAITDSDAFVYAMSSLARVNLQPVWDSVRAVT